MMCPCCTPDKDGQKSIPTKDIRANERPLHVIYAPQTSIGGNGVEAGEEEEEEDLFESFDSVGERESESKTHH